MTFATPPADQPRPTEPRVEIVRSRRRKRTVSGYRDGDLTVIQLPAGLPRAEEERCIADLLAKLARREARTRAGGGELVERANALSERYLAGRARPSDVRWVTNQNTRWGSCTPANGTIRLSHKLQRMPAWVVDYVIVHELAHLLVPAHGPRFWQLVESYPRTERARGFLEGVAMTAGLQLTLEEGEEGEEDQGCAGADPSVRVAGAGPAA